MSDGRAEFENRRNRIIHHHRALARGHSATLRSDGLIVLCPSEPRFRLPQGGVLLLAIVLFACLTASVVNVTDGAGTTMLSAEISGARTADLATRLDGISQIFVNRIYRLL